MLRKISNVTKLPIIFVFFAFLFLSYAGYSGCSRNEGFVQPPSLNPDEPNLPNCQSSEREAIAVYDLLIDPSTETVILTPDTRASFFHFPLNQPFPNVLAITGWWFKPLFHVSFRLSHPVPGCGIDLYDPRVIAIVPARPDVSFNYPVFNCTGNNSIVIDPDGYTKLHDKLGVSIEGNTNPFIAYFKDQPNRTLSSVGVTSETREWYLNLTGFDGPVSYKMVVDISTNYPNPSQPVVDNAPEPSILKTTFGPGLEPAGGSAKISVTFLDYQGVSDIKCKVECPDLFAGAIQLFYECPGPNPDEYIFSGTISNQYLAPEGDYNLLVAAWDIPTDIHVFQEVQVRVRDEIAFNPVVVTPGSLNFEANDFFIDGNYAYLAAGYLDLQIFDITDPLNPVWINRVEVGNCNDVVVSNGYAFVPDYYNGLRIIDVDPPSSASIYRTVPAYNSEKVFIADGYAYVIGDVYKFIIVDIDPIDSAAVVKTMDLSSIPKCVGAHDGYAYVGVFDEGLNVIDVDPPESASVVKIIPDMDLMYDICFYNGYAMVAACWDGLKIIDITPPESAFVYKTVDLDGRANDISISNGYAYIPTYKSHGLQIVDIEPLDLAFVAKSVPTPYSVEGVDVSNGYAYVTDKSCKRYHVINVDPVDTAYIEKTVESTVESDDICSVGNYMYNLKSSYPQRTLQIFDTYIPESAELVKLFDVPFLTDIEATEGYVYAIAYHEGLLIYDVDPPELAHLVKTISLPYDGRKVFISDDYAYVGLYDYNLEIVDIDPPEDAYIVSSLEMPELMADGCVSNGWAYIALYNRDLHIVDIDPPESAYILRSLVTPGETFDVCTYGDYLYIADNTGDLHIVDIDPPGLAYIVKSVDLTGALDHVMVQGGYVYASGGSGIKIVDVEPPESAFELKRVYTSHLINEICVSNEYAYLSHGEGGVEILKLW